MTKVLPLSLAVIDCLMKSFNSLEEGVAQEPDNWVKVGIASGVSDINRVGMTAFVGVDEGWVFPQADKNMMNSIDK